MHVLAPIDHVGSTQIFVSGLSDEEHATVYRMAYRAPEAVAMILPIPVRRGGAEDAVTFVDLGECRDFFELLDRCYPRPPEDSKPGGYGGRPRRPPLAVHENGDYVASYVPSIGDFDRLDPRFRLPATAWGDLPDYGGHGFAVIQLKPGKDPLSVQPIAYRYPPEVPHELFFPTVHLHDGEGVGARARYEHVLYAQPFRQHPNVRVSGWEPQATSPRWAMDLSRTEGLVAPDRYLSRVRLQGEAPNADLVLDPRQREASLTARPVRVPWILDERLGWSMFQKLSSAGILGGYD